MPTIADQADTQYLHFATAESQRRTVLVGFGEALSAPEVAWNLLDGGFRVVAFTRKGRKALVRRLRNVEVADITAPEEDIREALSQLKIVAERVGADAVMPLDDASVWLCNEVSSLLPTSIAGPLGRHCALAIDKRLQLKAAQDAGFQVIPTHCVEGIEEARQMSVFPMVLKSALAVSREGNRLYSGRIRTCFDSHDLEVSVRAWRAKGPTLVQPMLSGVGEGLFGLADRGVVCNWSAHRRIRMMNPRGSGSSACRSLPLHDQPVKVAEKMLSAVNWSGLFMIELLRDPSGQTFFMELNGRPWGSMALALRRGLDYPVWAATQRIDASFRPPRPPADRPVTCRHLGRELVHILMVLSGRTSQARLPLRSRLGMLLQVLRVSRSDCWYNRRNGNRLLFLEDAFETVWEALLRRSRSS